MLLAGSPFTTDKLLRATDAWDDVVESIGVGHRIRGMFISPVVGLLDDNARAAVLRTLGEPPRGGVFVPFLSYARRDYLRIVLAAARASVDDVALAERIRRIARNDFATFSASVFGKTIRAAVPTARAALLKTPQVYAVVAPADDGVVVGGPVDGGVELVFRRYPILWPYHLGQLEGMVKSYNEACAIDVDVEEDVVVYRVRLL